MYWSFWFCRSLLYVSPYSGILWGEDKYESWKEIYGDIGSWGLGYIGEVLGGLVGTAIEPVGGTIVLGYIGGAVVSVLGEDWFEWSFETFVPEDADLTVHWFWEEDWMPWNK